MTKNNDKESIYLDQE